MWFVTPTSMLLIVSGWLISVIALYAWNKRASFGFAPFFLLLGDALWKVCFGVALGTHDLPARLFWTSCQYIGIGMQVIGATLLAVTYAGKENWLTPRRNWILIGLAPALSVLLAFSNELHHLMWVQAQLSVQENLAVLNIHYGPLYWGYILYNYLVVILAALILARAAYRSSGQQRRQALILTIGILLPIIFHALYLARFKTFPLLELVSAMTYSFAALVVTWGLMRYPLLESILIPPARVVQEMPDAVMVMDNRSLLVDVNPAALRLLELTREQALGNSLQFLERQTKTKRPWDAEMLRKYQDTLEAQEEVILGTIESPQYFNMRISPLYDRQQQLTGRLVVLRDVTELQRREQALKDVNARLSDEMAARETAQQQVLEQTRDLAALDEREQLGRELHDGLGQMMGYLNLEAQTAQTLLQNNNIAALNTSLAHLVNVARDGHDDLRAFILGMRPVSHNLTLPQTLESMLEQFRQSSGVAASLDYPDNAPEPAFTPTIETVVVNVMREALSNIRKHAAAQQVSARFTFAGELAQFDIVDDGAGFRTTGKLFPRSKPGDQPKEGGAHFGLAVMRERVEQAGGRFEINSTPGKGTRVHVQLPCLPLHAEVDVEDLRAARGLRIMLVDDHPLFLDGLRSLLQTRGLTVVGLAHDGFEAQSIAEALRPDVVVMDVNMPGCGGLEATRNLKAALPETQVVILTVSEDEDNLYEAIQSGASGYLLKSLHANDFVRMLAGLSRGESPLTSGIAIRLMQKFDRRQPAITSSQPQDRPADRPEALNGRQWTILQYVAQGLKYKEIAIFLNVSERTVKREMGEVLDALHLETRREALKVARRPASAADPEPPPQK